MATGAVKASDLFKKNNQQTGSLFDANSTSEMIAETHTSELVIALCGPIGSPLHDVADIIASKMSSVYGYEECSIVRLSEFIAEHASKVNIEIPPNRGFERISKQIEAGNELRKQHGASVLAELAVDKIRVGREEHKKIKGSTRYETRRVCHIIDSIKNQDEFDLLRLVYREMVYFLGVFSSIETREENLAKKINSTSRIYELIERDSGEEIKQGQTVRDTFPLCDFFLKVDSGTDSQISRKVDRFLDLILGAKIITPTTHESAMYAAASAASNSACLSRQVGAAIASAEGEIISTGWNDVPKYGGGLYISNPVKDPNSETDKRCWNNGGVCANHEEKELIAEHIFSEIQEYVKPDQLDAAKSRIETSKKLKGLIEFSRSIHAEMHAILSAGKVAGEKIQGGVLYVTTYPCHSCARHIIAAGIHEVHYIEPYRKSLAIKLHGDSITEKEGAVGKVYLIPYEGVAPGKYLALFKMNPDSRKSNGRLIRAHLGTVRPRLDKSLEALPTLEAMVVESLRRKNLLPAGVPDHEPESPRAA